MFERFFYEWHYYGNWMTTLHTITYGKGDSFTANRPKPLWFCIPCFLENEENYLYGIVNIPPVLKERQPHCDAELTAAGKWQLNVYEIKL